MKQEINIGEQTHSVALIKTATGMAMRCEDGSSLPLNSMALDDDLYQFTVGEQTIQAKVVTKGEDVFIEAFGQTFITTVLDPVEQASAIASAGDISAKAPMPGVVVEVHVKEGDEVEEEQPLVTIESMKLFTVLKATGAGTVSAINFDFGDSFSKGAVMVQIESKEEEHA